MMPVINDNDTINPNGKQPDDFLTKEEADALYVPLDEGGEANPGHPV